MEICKIPSPYGDVTADQVKCLNDQAQLDSCVRKYDARFCYSLVGTCASMMGAVYNGGAISKLPGNVLLCIQREDVIAVCRAKHGVAFCTKLSEACAELTKIPMPAFQQGQLVALPDGLAECISKGKFGDL
ncbi:unnamed protein product [Anisakis simplex]|uniref:DUF1893 domain-containing protein n=1 Tax=Anisakis simplex TaxID=6269 RepID=A0A0M3KG99_ANISI|nr:unnamed protein product [Anisakis simplex]